MSDLISKLAKATFPGPIIKCLSGNANEQAVVSVGVRGADGEVAHEEHWDCIAPGESIQILDPIPGEVWIISGENLDDAYEDSAVESDETSLI